MFGISSSHRARVLRATLLIMFLVSARTGFAAQSGAGTVCDLRTTERIMAVGDVHGSYDRLVGILKAAGLHRQPRRGGSAAGRFSCRPATSSIGVRIRERPSICCAGSNARRPAPAGVSTRLLGNHEFMRMVSDWRYVSAEELDAFRTADSADLRERAFTVVASRCRAPGAGAAAADPTTKRRSTTQFVKDIPLGYMEMRQAFAATGDYGKWLRERPALVRINGIVFVHGGISGGTAALGCDGINQAVRSDLAVAESDR